MTEMRDEPIKRDAQGPLRAPKGTQDILWPESSRWEVVVAHFADLARRAGYGLALTPVFEEARVFRRGIGEQSEVVGKEMYEFEDRGGRLLALRPEGTAPLVRAFVQHRPTLPWKAWYVTPAFRYEQPQAGRYRQHHQLGVEALGTDDADLDVEVICIAHEFYSSLGLRRIALAINSMGCQTCRPTYVEALRSFLSPHSEDLCPEHQAHYSENVLRVLDCKKKQCRDATANAPRISEYLCEPCSVHMSRVLAGLESLGVAHRVEPRLVRGFDYYTRTTFEFSAEALGSAQNAVGGGGRYNGLVEELGGPPTPGIGFGIGIERLLLACDAESCLPVSPPALDAFVVDLTGGESARDLTAALRGAGLAVARAYDDRSLKSQMKLADRSGALLALIVGPDELAAGTVAVHPMHGDAEQFTVSRVDAVGRVREHLMTFKRPMDDQGVDRK